MSLLSMLLGTCFGLVLAIREAQKPTTSLRKDVLARTQGRWHFPLPEGQKANSGLNACLTGHGAFRG